MPTALPPAVDDAAGLAVVARGSVRARWAETPGLRFAHAPSLTHVSEGEEQAGLLLCGVGIALFVFTRVRLHWHARPQPLPSTLLLAPPILPAPSLSPYLSPPSRPLCHSRRYPCIKLKMCPPLPATDEFGELPR